MWHYKIVIQYYGLGFCGWQKQGISSASSVQGLLEAALHKLANSNVPVFAAGRTDAGVHALGQVVSFNLSKYFAPITICKALNFYLDKRIVVHSAELVPPDFHARFSAKSRTYLYRIMQSKFYSPFSRYLTWLITRPLSLEAMQQAAFYLYGYHDFSSFRSAECQAKSPFRTIDWIKIETVKTLFEHEMHFYVKAKSFLHNQVRIIVGTLVEVGLGKKTPENVQNILMQRSRSLAGITAPAYGLFLLNVEY